MPQTPTHDRLAASKATPSRMRAYLHGVRRGMSPEDRSLAWLVLGTLFAAACVVGLKSVPISAFVLPLVVASVLLGPSRLPWFTIFLLTVATLTVPFDTLTNRVITQIVLLFVLGLLVLIGSFRRSRLGVAGVKGEQMFVDLRDRILARADIPALPDNWYAQSVVRSAGGTPFAGDFVVAVRTGDQLGVAVVDVSGKGEDAATRALLLAGAFGGLLGAVPAEQFLRAANEYLLRQDWGEGFATAIHLSVDLESGSYQLRTAGHPPAARFDAGAGKWDLDETHGPLLGLVEGADYEASVGTVRPGDAMLLYTDGLVEAKDRDIMLGIDKMIGHAERLLQAGFEDGAQTLVDELGSPNDDRAIIVIHRR
ncbi:MAG: PP2C family protein-serine/threonine phosphatase [Nocardioides sp.]